MFPMDRADLPNRGETLYLPTDVIDPNNLRANGKEGAICYFEDVNPHTGVKRSNRMVKCIWLRNLSPVTLLASQLARFKAGTLHCQLDQLANVTAQPDVIPLDEYLPSYGVRQYDGCWCVLEGPAIVLTSSTAGALNVIAVGDLLVAVTANGTTNADAGHVATETAAATDLALDNIVGEAMSAMTTSQTVQGVLALVHRLKG